MKRQIILMGLGLGLTFIGPVICAIGLVEADKKIG